MPLEQKFEFFAPIWRVMRDDNMTAEEVRRQIEHVALAVKRGSEVRGWRAGRENPLPRIFPPFPYAQQVSDMRHHVFRGRLRGAQVLFLRAQKSGACDYVDDGR